MKYVSALQKVAFRADNISVVNVIRDQNYRHSYKSGRTQHGFIYIVSGSIENRFFGCTTELIVAKKGDFVFIPQGTSYIARYLEDGTELKIVQFDLLCGELPEYLAAPVQIDLPDAGEIVEEFFALQGDPPRVHSFYSLSRLYDLFWRLEKKHAKIPTKYKKLKPALQDISEHCEQSRPIAEYAEMCNMSEVNFRRLFKEYTGASPVEYRNGVRLEGARAKLISGEYNVSEAAEVSGFSNLSFFIRLYKKKFGCTPKGE